jgi:hypothetical protein
VLLGDETDPEIISEAVVGALEAETLDARMRLTGEEIVSV